MPYRARAPHLLAVQILCRCLDAVPYRGRVQRGTSHMCMSCNHVAGFSGVGTHILNSVTCAHAAAQIGAYEPSDSAHPSQMLY